jgi:hypothetical protein
MCGFIRNNCRKPYRAPSREARMTCICNSDSAIVHSVAKGSTTSIGAAHALAEVAAAPC